MEKIEIEVDSKTAKMWQNASAEIKKSIERKFSTLFGEISYRKKVAEFEALLDKASDEAKRNGLTEEILEKLLNEE